MFDQIVFFFFFCMVKSDVQNEPKKKFGGMREKPYSVNMHILFVKINIHKRIKDAKVLIMGRYIFVFLRLSIVTQQYIRSNENLSLLRGPIRASIEYGYCYVTRYGNPLALLVTNRMENSESPTTCIFLFMPSLNEGKPC